MYWWGNRKHRESYEVFRKCSFWSPVFLRVDWSSEGHIEDTLGIPWVSDVYKNQEILERTKIMTLCQTEKTGAGHGLVCEKLQNSSWDMTGNWLLLGQPGILCLSWTYEVVQLGGVSTGRMPAVLCKDCKALCPAWAWRGASNAQWHVLCSTKMDWYWWNLGGLKCLRALSALGSGTSVGLGGQLVEEDWEMVREFKASDLHNLSFPCSWGGLWGDVTGA